MEPRTLLHGHMEDLAGRAAREGYAASRFLTPSEAHSVSALFSKRHGAALVFDGGYEDAERVRAVFLNPDWGDYNREALFSALRITYRAQDNPGHRDILGSVMGLGVERDAIGDIAVRGQSASLVCLPEIGPYIAENLTKVGRFGVLVSVISLPELPAAEQKLEIRTDTVASLRLDGVLCAAFNLSRTKAAGLISAGRVNLNYEPCIQPSKELDEGALLSVRGLGRAKLLEIGGASKKGRIFIKIGLYGG